MAAALVAAAALLVGACTGSGGGGGREAVSSPTSVAPAPVPSGLDALYAQRLAWAGCGDGFQCAKLTVPVDYAEPAGATIQLAVIRLRASRSGDHLGSLVLNPGGPGGSGVQYARAAQSVVSETLRRHYDVVGFDPRGVGASAPLQCLTDAETDRLVGADPTPDDAAEVQQSVDLAKQMARQCAAKGGDLLAHVGTKDAARDMDVLRAALGDQRLNYLGKSYGTFLGATYAEEFPRNVGKMVLDGAIDPALTSDQVNGGQAAGFEQATRAFVEDCVQQGDCVLGSDVDRGTATLRSMIHDLDSDPAATNDPDRPLTEGRGSFGIAAAMYDQQSWPVLRQGLSQLRGGRGDVLLQLSDALSDRGPNGYNSNQNTVIYAVNCLDRPDRRSTKQIEATVAPFTKLAPTWGPFLAWSELPCTVWPVRGDGEPAPIHATGSGPIVVVGTTRDPATPYAWAQGLAKELDAGHLLTYVGDGHTAYRRGSRCIDSAIDAYYLRGDLPADGTRCS
ncbi:alpha/beta hydrolase [Angustibacter aerolatus]